MVKVAIGVLIVCLLMLGVNAFSTAALPVIPWFDNSLIGRRLGKPVRQAIRVGRRVDGWIRGPNGPWPPRRQRAGTGRRWDAGETLDLPRDPMRRTACAGRP